MTTKRRLEMSDQNNTPVFKDYSHFIMFAKPGDNGSPRLVWGARGSNPRLTVYTNESKENKKQNVIYAGMDPVTAMQLLLSFEAILKGPNNVTGKIVNYTAPKTEDGKPGDKVVLSETLYGKDENGIAWISLIQEGKPKIKFEYRPSNWHKFFKKVDGQVTEITESEASVGQAMSTIMVLKKVLFKDSDWQRPMLTNANSRTPSKAPSIPVDDDIPF